MGLTRWLLTGDRGGVSERTLRRQLRSPWGWPCDRGLAEAAASRGAHARETPGVGETLMVSVIVEGLWHLSPRRRTGDALELSGAAAESALLAQRLVTRDLPLYDDASRLHEGRVWSARAFVLPPPASSAAALDGGSYGLSLSLATASVVLRLPLPGDLAGTGALQADGTIGPVAGLARKVELVVENAPGITRFLVPALQADEARLAAERAFTELGVGPERAWLQIVPVSSFHEAFARAFPGAEEEIRERWSAPEVATRLVEQLHRVTLFDSPIVLGWPAIERCAERLSRSTLPPRAQRRLALVQAIARRHGGHKEPHPWPDEADLAEEPRAVRLRHLAQVVQSHAEGGDDPCAAAERVREWVRPRLERAAEDAVLLGAMGRALGAAERDEAAIEVLREAVATWQDIACPHDSTLALCELLRLLGIAGRADEVREVVARDVPPVEADPRTSEKSLGFVRVALGRVYTQLGWPGLALGELRDVPAGRALPFIAEGGRLRWLALAHDAQGERTEAAAARRALEARQDPPVPWALQTRLAALDQARRDGTVTEATKAEVRALAELDRSLSRCPPGRDWAAHLTERSRY